MPEISYSKNSQEQAQEEASALQAQQAGGSQEQQTMQREQQAQQLLAQVLNGQIPAEQFIAVVEQSGLAEPVIRNLLAQLMGGIENAILAGEK